MASLTGCRTRASAIVAIVWLTGCGGDPGGEADTAIEAAAPTEPTVPATAPAPAPAPAPTTGPAGAEVEAAAKVARFLGLEAPKPATWVWRPPNSRMRAANYTVPGREGRDAAEVVVFFFGQGQGGSTPANIDRWAGQFRSADGGPVEPKIEGMEAGGMPVTLVELAGAYQGMGQPTFTPGQLFLAAIVDAPVGQVFVRLVGPAETVEENREEFMTLIRGLRKAPG